MFVILKYGRAFYTNPRAGALLNEPNANYALKQSYPLSKRSIFTYNYGNIFIGYTKDRYYWEAVMMSTKLLLIVV